MAARAELGGIQILRGIAALAVVFDHASSMAELPKYFGRPMLPALQAGAVGVDLFFVLSGFIICYVSLAPRTLAPTTTAKNFLLKRFVRIVPFLWVVVLAYGAFWLLGRGGRFDAAPYLRAMVLWPVGELTPNVVWTLRHEAIFYGLFALTFLAARPWLLAIWLAAPLVASWFVDPHSLAGLAFSNVNLLFGAGLVVGIVFLRGVQRKVPPLLLAAATIAVFVLAMLLHYDRTQIWQVLIVATACAGAVVCGANASSSGRVWRLGERLGDASYSIYLTHTMFISAALGFVSHRWPDAPPFLVVPSLAVVGVLAGCAVHYGVERRLLKMLRSLTLARRKPVEAPAI